MTIYHRRIIAVTCIAWVATMGICVHLAGVWIRTENFFAAGVHRGVSNGSGGGLVLRPVSPGAPNALSLRRTVGPHTGETVGAKPRSSGFAKDHPANAHFEATAYSHFCTMPLSGIEGPPQPGANGRWPVAHETVAADPSIPFGTVLEISHDGIVSRRVVGDRGLAIRGRRLDLFMESCEQARRWGRRMVSVSVIGGE